MHLCATDANSILCFWLDFFCSYWFFSFFQAPKKTRHGPQRDTGLRGTTGGFVFVEEYSEPMHRMLMVQFWKAKYYMQ